MLIEVALPLASINAESAREKFIRHGFLSVAEARTHDFLKELYIFGLRRRIQQKLKCDKIWHE
jgi:hypothetical protein